MAPCDSFHPKPRTLQHTPLVDRVDRVGTARGRVATMGTHHGRNGKLVNANGQYENLAKHELLDRIGDLAVLAVFQLHADCFQIVADPVRQSIVPVCSRLLP